MKGEENVSIHASAREATRAVHGIFRQSGFNPRLREGGDSWSCCQIWWTWVSIHASAREATNNVVNGISSWLFQSTPPRGRRHLFQDPHGSISMFQSTPPRGRRLSSLSALIWSTVVSIHASAREATCQCASRVCIGNVSIHASAREATPLPPEPWTVNPCFNPRLREGGDLAYRFNRCSSRVSIHASAREAT